MAYANHFGPKGSSRSVLKLKVSHEKFWIGHRGTHKKLLGHHRSGKCKKIRVRGRRKLEPISALLPLFLTFLGSYGYKVRLDVSILEGAHYSWTYSKNSWDNYSPTIPYGNVSHTMDISNTLIAWCYFWTPTWIYVNIWHREWVAGTPLSIFPEKRPGQLMSQIFILTQCHFLHQSTQMCAPLCFFHIFRWNSAMCRLHKNKSSGDSLLLWFFKTSGTVSQMFFRGWMHRNRAYRPPRITKITGNHLLDDPYTISCLGCSWWSTMSI